MLLLPQLLHILAMSKLLLLHIFHELLSLLVLFDLRTVALRKAHELVCLTLIKLLLELINVAFDKFFSDVGDELLLSAVGGEVVLDVSGGTLRLLISYCPSQIPA